MTTTPENKGAQVVESVIKQIKDTGIFPDDKGFLRRIAKVESNDGEDAGTYRAGYDGGIWQVDNIGFKDTQNTGSHPGLATKYDKIEQKLNIAWKSVSWSDLRKPLYSGLAARLFLSNVPAAIPGDLDGQAGYWKDHYNSAAGAGSKQKFLDRVGNL